MVGSVTQKPKCESQDGNPCVYFNYYPNDTKSLEGSGKKLPSKPLFLGLGTVPFTSPEDLMKNLPEAISNMLEGRGMGMPYDIPIFKINMKEYEIYN